ncbi:MAG TPA: CoA pyrophosphatase [Ktedonobacteraceae bacterium]|nr:CoA pyrophosphatase [Ktedonobacteraceae bacterium]
MDVSKSEDVILALRQRLEPVQHAGILIDAYERQFPSARRASVLIPLFEKNNETYIVFIRRASSLRAHSGEIAFPGGATEVSDVSPIVTALREAQEEIGLAPSRVEVLGVMPPVFTVVSNFLITPVVAYLPSGPGSLQLQASEVAEIIFLPLQGLADPSIFHTEEWVRNNESHTVYFYDYGSYRVWGATARMFTMLLELLRNAY